MTRRPKTVSIAEDDRARIPFALVGVLLLLSSATIVGYLQARPDPQSNIDPSLALDRSEATTQSAIKDAIVDASDRVAASPVTEPANDGAFEGLLGDDSTDEDVVFRRYAALVAYQEIHDRIDGTNETIRDNATARVTLPPIEDEDDAEEAMDRVSFLAGFERADMENGTVRVTVEDVTYEVYNEGELVTTREEDVTVTVATPLFQLHHRVGVYQDRLEMSMLDGDGFEGLGREFAARTFPIVIGKSMFNYYRGNPREAPFKEIVPERQTEVLANHAIYGVQSKTFGTRDPLWDRPMKAQSVCWLAWEYYENYDGSAGGDDGSGSNNDDGSGSDGSNGNDGDSGSNDDSNSDDSSDSGSSSMLPAPDDSWAPNADSSNSQYSPSQYEYWCEGAEFLFGDSSGTPGKVPSLDDIVAGSGNDNAMQGTERVNYTQFAQQAFVDVHPDNEGAVDHETTDLSDEEQSQIDEVRNENPQTFGFSSADLTSITNQVYSMDLRVSKSGSGASLDVDPTTPSSIDDPNNWTTSSTSRTEDLGESVEITDEWQNRDDASNHEPKFFTVEAEDTVKLVEEWTWTHDEDGTEITRTFEDTGTATATIEVYGEYAGGASLTQSGSYYTGESFTDQTSYRGHSGDVENLFSGSNGINGGSPDTFDEAPESSFQTVFDTGRSGAESAFEAELDGDSHTDRSDITSELNNPASADGDSLGPEAVTSSSREELREFTESALATGRHRVIEQGPREFDRTEFLTGTPFADMGDYLIDQRETVVYGGDEGTFTSMPNFLRASVLHHYHKTAVQYTNFASQSRGEETDRLEVDSSSLNEGVELAQDAVNRDPPSYDATLESSDLLGNVSFEVRGSPTYLEFDDVDREEVPAIRPPGAGASDVEAAEGVEHVPAASCYNNRMGYFGLPLLPWPGSWYVTASSWGVDVEGEYARFEVTANVSEPSRSTSLSYVREDKNVSTTIAGVEDEIGNVEPVEVDTFAEFPMVVPAGKAGTGDPKHSGPDNDVETEEWDFTGPGWDDQDPDADC